MSIWKEVATIGTEVYKEVKKLDEQEQEKRLNEKMELEERRLQSRINHLETAENLKELTEKFEMREANLIAKIKRLENEVRELKTVKFYYSTEKLNSMSTTDLRKEVYSIYKENYSLFDEKYEIGKEARKLYNEEVYSVQRYRAKLIKFLFEKGNI